MAFEISGLKDSSAARLCEELKRAGFTDDNLQRIAAKEYRAPLWYSPPIAFTSQLRGSVLCPGTPLGVLLRLFQEGDEIQCSDLETCLSTPSIELLERVGMIERNQQTFRAKIALVPWRDLFVACDRADADQRYDYVFAPVAGTARMEAGFGLLFHGDRAVDIGTGSGALALALVARGVTTIAIDPNERCGEYLRLNCAINRLPPPEFRVSDHSILGELSDLDYVVFNAPKTYSIETAMAWGHQSEGVGRDVIRQAYRLLPKALASHGFACMRHDLLLTKLTVDAFHAEFEVPAGLDVLFFHESEAARRQIVEVGVDEPWVHGCAFIRRQPVASAPPSVRLMPQTFDEVTRYQPRHLWRRIVDLPGWGDVLSRGHARTGL